MAALPHIVSDARQSSEHDFPIVVANSPFTIRERRIALGIITLLLAGAAAVAPVASVQLGRVDSFVPALQTTLCAAELTTAILLFSQYISRPQSALLALGSGYIASGLFAFLHSLNFPGAYASTGLFGGPDTGAWLYCFWHIGFPLSVLAYLLLRDRGGGESLDRSPLRTIVLVVVSTLAAIAAITCAVSASTSILPALYEADLRTQTPFTSYLTGSILLLNVISLVLMFRRQRTTLDLWLVIALFTALPDLLLPTVLSAPRFSVAWYAARGYALITSIAVLSLLLTETMTLYQRLASAVVSARQERANRLMSLDVATSAIIHEIRQPLSTIAASCDAALSWLAGRPPNLEEAREDLEASITSTRHADEVLKSVRSLFQNTVSRTPLSIEDIVEQALRLLHHDLRTNRVLLQRAYAYVPFPIVGDRMQLQQVVLNLIKNAVDAMGTTGTRRLQITTGHHKNSVTLQIDDSGPGVPDGTRDQIFDPFFTTKPNGMGLGLSICRQIIEAHGGSLQLANTSGLGSSFLIELPIVKAKPQ